jgi:mono/diheme cytochrome c family protein
VGLLVGLSASVIWPAPIVAQEDLAERGRIIAETSCGSCHATGANGASPISEAPPLRTFKTLWPVDNLAEALAEGIMVGHPEMPEIAMTSSQIDAFLAYLESF